MDNEKTESTPVIIGKALLGAVLGSIPAMILWVVLGKVGVVAAIAGFFMIAGELIACDRFTKNSTSMNIQTAVIICAAVMLINVFVCERIIWSWEICDALNENGLEVTIFECFKNFKSIAELLEIQEDFTASLVQSYLFGILGAVAGVVKLAKR